MRSVGRVRPAGAPAPAPGPRPGPGHDRGGDPITGQLPADRRGRPAQLGGDGAHPDPGQSQVRDPKPFLQRQVATNQLARRRRDPAAGSLTPTVTLVTFHPDSLTGRGERRPRPHLLPEPSLPLQLTLLPLRHGQHLSSPGVLRGPSEAGLPLRDATSDLRAGLDDAVASCTWDAMLVRVVRRSAAWPDRITRARMSAALGEVDSDLVTGELAKRVA